MATPSLTSQTKYAGTFSTSVPSGGGHINNPTNYTDSNINTYADIEGVNPGNKWYLETTNYGFTLPSNAIIKGLYYTQKIQADGGTYYGCQWKSYHIFGTGGTYYNWAVNYGRSKVIINNNTNASWGPLIYTGGGSTDLWNYSSWTAAKINSSDFGIHEITTEWRPYTHYRFFYNTIQVYYYEPLTASVSNLSIITKLKTSVNVSANIINTGYLGTDGYVTERGFCYKLASSVGDPTTSNSKVSDSGSFSAGTYSKNITGLTQAETYKVRPYVINAQGTAYGNTTEIQLLGFKDPTNAYSSNNTYTTIGSTDGKLDVKLSVNNGSSFTSVKTATLPTGSGSEDSVILGENGDTWGLSIDGDSLDDGTFTVRIAPNSSPTNNEQDYKDFSFSVSPTYRITGIEVKLEGYYDDVNDIIYLDWLSVRIWYGNTPTPVIEGSMAYASDGRKNGETAGNGSGVATFWDGSNWIAVDSGDLVDD